ncbi:MAG: hydrogenase maturation nickel metallochaperone HypA [Chlamydiota bacterium]|nr:hydrogenase maturation nickel metallochaperone HypA [Chlamydiota bacterium]
MHEMSLITDLIKKVHALADEQKAKRVLSIKIRLGALSHMSKEHFLDHFKQVSKGTYAQEARLDIVEASDVSDPNAQSVLLESIEVGS